MWDSIMEKSYRKTFRYLFFFMLKLKIQHKKCRPEARISLTIQVNMGETENIVMQF